MEQASDGILLVDKQEGETSYEVVKRARRSLKIRKVGHAGTLDPFATGLLILLLGQGTKLSQFLMAGKKTYMSTLRLGVETDTLDLTGRVVRTNFVPNVTLEQVQAKSLGFVGNIEQVPPVYSAVKHGGTRAYKLARDGVQVSLKKRLVRVHSLQIISVQLPDITMKVTCSSGTYIRTLAADLGRALGPGGHLTSLRRLASGPFGVQNAISSRDIIAETNRTALWDKIIPLAAALPDMRAIQVHDLLAKKIRYGYQPSWDELHAGLDLAQCKDGYVKVVTHNELVAIINVKNHNEVGHGELKVMRVFT